MKLLAKIAGTLLLAAAGVCLAGAVSVSAAPQRGLGQSNAEKTPAQRRAERQARMQARAQRRAQAQQQHGAAPSGSVAPAQPGGSSGANARAGTPRSAPGEPTVGAAAPAAQPATSMQPGGTAGANARAGIPRTPASGAPAQQPQGAIPSDWMNRLQQMPPEERERFLQNNQKFQSLPPQQQAQIRQRFNEWNKLTPQQRQNMERNASALARLTTEQRQAVRTQLLPQWRQLAPERRQEIKQRLNGLNGLSDEERSRKLNDPSFYQGLSPQEHDVLKQMGDLRLNPGAGGG